MSRREVVNSAFALASARREVDEAVDELLTLSEGRREVLEAAQERFLQMVDDLPGDPIAQRALVLLRLAIERAV